MNKKLAWFYAFIILLMIQCGPDPQDFYTKARGYEQKEDFSKAAELIDQAIKIDPKNAEYFMSKGYYLSQLGHVEEAIAAYKKSYKLDDQPHVGYCLAELLAGNGSYKEAEPYAIVVVSGNTGFVPAVTLLSEIELALWKTDNALQCIQALDFLKVDAGNLKQEMKRRNSIIKSNAVQKMRGIKNHFYMKTGTVLTGTSKDTGTETEESLFAVVDDEKMSDVLARMTALAREFGAPAEKVISFPTPGGNSVTDALIKAAGARFLKKTDSLKGLSVWICMENYTENSELKELYKVIKEQGGRPYIFAFAVSRSALRQGSLGPDIAGTGGLVKIDKEALNMQNIAKKIKKFFGSKKDTYIKEQQLFYSGFKADIRIKEKR